jgi:hypothetical protein
MKGFSASSGRTAHVSGTMSSRPAERTLAELWLNGVCDSGAERRPRLHALAGQVPELNRRLTAGKRR